MVASQQVCDLVAGGPVAEQVAVYPEAVDLLHLRGRLRDIPAVGEAIGTFIARLVDPGPR